MDNASRTRSPSPINELPGIGGAHEPIQDLHDLLEVPLQEDGLPAVAPEEIPIELPDHQLDLEDYVINNLAAWLARQHEIFADLVVNPALNNMQPALPRRQFLSHVEIPQQRAIHPIPHAGMRPMLRQWTQEGVLLRQHTPITECRQQSTYIKPHTKLFSLVEQEILALHDKGFIKKVPSTFVKCSMPIFAVPKSSQDKSNIRLVYDCRHVNKFLTPPPYKLPTIPKDLQSCPKGFGFVSDISSGYHHIPLHEDVKQYLCFQWRKVFFCWNVVPFGLSTAPWIFTTWLKSYISAWKKNHPNSFVRQYIDDILVVCKDEQKASLLRQSFLSFLAEHGIKAHDHKTTPVLAKLKYLGYEVDLQEGFVSLSNGRKAQVKRVLSILNSFPKLPYKFAEKLLGLLNWCRAGSRQVLALIKPFYLDIHQTTSYFVKFKPHCLDFILPLLERKTFFRVNSAPFTIYTDATLTQGAYISNNVPVNFPLPFKYRESSFTAEFYAAMVAINNNLRHKHIHLYCDNIGVCFVLKKGTTNHSMISAILPSFWRRLEQAQVKISITWIPSEENPADYFSRSALLSLS